MTYLERLTIQLATGLEGLADELIEPHVQYIRRHHNADGGYSGREGPSDLYYTSFALRSLALLGRLSRDEAENAARFLRGAMQKSAGIVDIYALLQSAALVQLAGGPNVLGEGRDDWPERLAGGLERFRTEDGGYGKSTDARSGSTYHTFLVGMCYELLGRDIPDPDRVLAFVASRKREDGGYVEMAPMRRSGTNPTAAAVGIHQLIQGDDFDPKRFADTAAFLAGLVSMEGGLCANTRIPVADLLSTFTGCWTLAQLEALAKIRISEAQKYVASLQRTGGGFRGGIWDEGHDVEYTFYGLGLLALLNQQRKSQTV